jgi:endonuclease/exonuclease/phosphatase (EEP) superfamily protein YafD
MTGVTAAGLLLTGLRTGLWYLDAASYWLPAYLALSIVGAGCCLIGRAPRSTAAAAVCAAVAAVMIAPCYAASSSEVRAANLRVLQANVYEHNTDPDALLKLIREANPDVILLQEVDAAWEERLRPLDASYPHKSFAPRYPKGSPDLAQFWRGDSEVPRELSEAGIPATLAVIRVNGRTVNLLNVHTAAPFSPTRAAPRQRASGLRRTGNLALLLRPRAHRHRSPPDKPRHLRRPMPGRARDRLRPPPSPDRPVRAFASSREILNV